MRLDLRSLSDEELRALQRGCRNEIKRRRQAATRKDYADRVIEDVRFYETLQEFDEENCYVALLEIQRLRRRLEKKGII